MKMADSFDRENAVATDMMGRPKPTDEQVRKARALSIARMRLAGYTYAAIGRFHGISRIRAFQIHKGTPVHVKARPAEVLDARPEAAV